MTANEAAKAVILEAIDLARGEAAKEEIRLGRTLTDAEVGGIASMVERQLRTALVLARR